MKRLLPLIIAIFMATVTGVSAKGGLTLGQRFGAQDTIVVKMTNGAKMVLQLQNIEQLKSFRNYSLDSLIVELIKYSETMDKTGPGYKTMTVTLGSTPSGGEPEKVTIVVQKTGKDGTRKTERHEIKIDMEVDFDLKDPSPKVTVSRVKADTTHVKKPKPAKATKFGLDFDFGLNTFVNQESGADIPDLKPLGSRYVSINWRMKSRVGGSNSPMIRVGDSKSPLYILSGLEFAFNNYMFDRNYVIEEDEKEAFFRRATNISYEKSKLTHSSVNLPIMPTLHFKNSEGKDGFTIGAGGFAGYRLGSHSKLKYSENGSTVKDKVRSNYNLSDFQYGLTGMIGYGNINLFVKYNMNSLFKDNRGPDMNVISFGIRLL